MKRVSGRAVEAAAQAVPPTHPGPDWASGRRAQRRTKCPGWAQSRAATRAGVRGGETLATRSAARVSAAASGRQKVSLPPRPLSGRVGGLRASRRSLSVLHRNASAGPGIQTDREGRRDRSIGQPSLADDDSPSGVPSGHVRSSDDRTDLRPQILSCILVVDGTSVAHKLAEWGSVRLTHVGTPN